MLCNNTASYDLYLEICKLITNTNNILKINSMYKEQYLLRWTVHQVGDIRGPVPPHGTPSGRTPDRYVPGMDNRFSETKNNDSLYLSQQLVQTKIEVKLSMCWTYAGTQSSLSCQTWSKRLTAFVFAPGSDHKRSLSGECKHRMLLFHLKDETQSLGISTCSPVLSVIDCKRLSFSHFIKNSVSLSNYLWVSKMRDVALKLLIKAHSLHLRVTNKV